MLNPASRAMSRMDVAWNPLSLKTFSAASSEAGEIGFTMAAASSG